MSALAPLDQQILRKYFLEEKDKDEICREMGITRDYLRVRVYIVLLTGFVRPYKSKLVTFRKEIRHSGETFLMPYFTT